MSNSWKLYFNLNQNEWENVLVAKFVSFPLKVEWSVSTMVNFFLLAISPTFLGQKNIPFPECPHDWTSATQRILKLEKISETTISKILINEIWEKNVFVFTLLKQVLHLLLIELLYLFIRRKIWKIYVVLHVGVLRQDAWETDLHARHGSTFNRRCEKDDCTGNIYLSLSQSLSLYLPRSQSLCLFSLGSLSPSFMSLITHFVHINFFLFNLLFNGLQNSSFNFRTLVVFLTFLEEKNTWWETR